MGRRALAALLAEFSDLSGPAFAISLDHIDRDARPARAVREME